MIDSATRSLVIARARSRCEYCRLPQSAHDVSFWIDHILPQQHLSDDSDGNLALTCPKCNRKKGPNLAGLDPVTRAIVPLFHPRIDEWPDHFQWTGVRIVGQTPCGRATVTVLELNSDDRLAIRISLAAEGLFPPDV